MQKTILYAVLNWGLGHATRSIPIIQYLLEQDYRIIIASDGLALALLQKEFPQLTFEQTSSYDVVYASQEKLFNLSIAKQIPKFIAAIKAEHKDCTRLCLTHQVDYIISDNRYGFYHKSVPSAFICHQLRLLYPESNFVSNIINKSYQGYLKPFTELWVPDVKMPESISQEMSALPWDNVHYIGIDSRLSPQKIVKKYAFIAILSGPEPQRTLLEEEIIARLAEEEGQHLVVRGTKNGAPLSLPKHIHSMDLLSTTELNIIINQAETIICRAGYTSVLDLLKLQSEAILIPTPGQAEQEYLAEVLSKKKWFTKQVQGSITLKEKISQVYPTLSFGYKKAILQRFLSSPTF